MKLKSEGAPDKAAQMFPAVADSLSSYTVQLQVPPHAMEHFNEFMSLLAFKRIKCFNLIEATGSYSHRYVNITTI